MVGSFAVIEVILCLVGSRSAGSDLQNYIFPLLSMDIY